jgi:hypothetical protein
MLCWKAIQVRLMRWPSPPTGPPSKEELVGHSSPSSILIVNAIKIEPIYAKADSQNPAQEILSNDGINLQRCAYELSLRSPSEK